MGTSSESVEGTNAKGRVGVSVLGIGGRRRRHRVPMSVIVKMDVIVSLSTVLMRVGVDLNLRGLSQSPETKPNEQYADELFTPIAEPFQG